MKTPNIIQAITDLANISQLINSHFDDEQKTTLWLNTENPLLGGQEPIEMILKGRAEKLQDFITTQLKGNTL